MFSSVRLDEVQTKWYTMGSTAPEKVFEMCYSYMSFIALL